MPHDDRGNKYCFCIFVFVFVSSQTRNKKSGSFLLILLRIARPARTGTTAYMLSMPCRELARLMSSVSSKRSWYAPGNSRYLALGTVRLNCSIPSERTILSRPASSTSVGVCQHNSEETEERGGGGLDAKSITELAVSAGSTLSDYTSACNRC